MYLINIFTLNKLIYWNREDLIITLTCTSYIGIWILAPIEHRNNTLSCIEKNHYKKVVRYLISIVLIISLVGINLKFMYEYSLYLASVIVCIFIMLILAIIKEKRGVFS